MYAIRSYYAKIVREHGVMNGKIVFEGSHSGLSLEELEEYVIVDAVKSVTCKNEEVFYPEHKKHKVVLRNNFV